MTLALSAFSTFDTTDTSNLAPRWRRYVQRFENRATALNILSAERKIALLLDYAGEAVYDDFQTLVVPAPEAENPRDIYQRSLQALNDLYAPKVQVEYERFNFREATQLLDENLDQFVTRLKKLAATCDFADSDSEIKSQIIQKCRSSKLRTKALADMTIKLDQLIQQGKVMEKAINYAKVIEKKEVNTIQQGRENTNNQPCHQHYTNRGNTHRNNYRDNTYRDNTTQYDDHRHNASRGRNNGGDTGHHGRGRGSYTQTRDSTAECDHCGGPYPHEGGRSKCPAYNAECHQCGLVGHYGRKCRGGAPPPRLEYRDRGRSHGYRGRGRRNVNYVDHDDQQQHPDTDPQATSNTPTQIQPRQDVNTFENQQNTYDDEDNYIFTIHEKRETVQHYSIDSTHTPKPVFIVNVDDNPVKMFADTGAPVNIIGEITYQTLHPKPTLQPADTTLYPYGKDRPPIALLGKFQATLSSDYAQDYADIYVTEGDELPLLSRYTAETLNLIKINQNAAIYEAVTTKLMPANYTRETNNKCEQKPYHDTDNNPDSPASMCIPSGTINIDPYSPDFGDYMPNTPAPQRNLGAVEGDPPIVDPPVPIPRRPPRHSKDCAVKTNKKRPGEGYE